MAKTINKLSPLAVAAKKEAGYYGDGLGLYLQVSKSGSKSWIFRYKFAKQSHEIGLGSVSDKNNLARAREKAKELKESLQNGKDPLETRRATKLADALDQANAMTFDQCAAAYIASHRSGWKNAKHASQWQNTLETYASPLIGKLPVAAIDTALVVRVLEPIWLAKTETATRLRGRIEAVLDWAKVMEKRQGDNPARWRGHLDKLLPKQSRVKRTEHHAALPWQQIGEFMLHLRQQEGIAAKAAELAILTACRSGEVRLATWQEFNFDAAMWVIPAERMKAGIEHRVPLSAAVLALLESMPRMGDLIFPGTKYGKPLSDMSLTAVLKRMKRGDLTMHGFRSSFRDWCAESLTNAFPREVCEHALAHRLSDKAEAAYQRGDMFEKRKLLMAAWADYCGTVPTVANVSPIRKLA